MILQNVSPLGDVLVAGYGFVEAGAKFTVNAADIEGLIGQVENFEPVDGEAIAARAAHLSLNSTETGTVSADETPPAEVAGDSADVAPPTENEAP
jgi:hypothetical protein